MLVLPTTQFEAAPRESDFEVTRKILRAVGDNEPLQGTPTCKPLDTERGFALSM